MNRARPPAAPEAIMAGCNSKSGDLLNSNCSGLTTCVFGKYRISIADRTVPMVILLLPQSHPAYWMNLLGKMYCAY
jgi:hypothetical protein